jgi:hypothetical protein
MSILLMDLLSFDVSEDLVQFLGENGNRIMAIVFRAHCEEYLSLFGLSMFYLSETY